MAYATVFHVAARNAARGTYTAQTIPAATTVVQYIQEAAAVLDSWLYDQGYAAPFDPMIATSIGGAGATTTLASSAVLLLQNWNSIGAALWVEKAAQASDRVPEFEKLWAEVLEMVKNTDLTLPRATAKAYPRQFQPPRDPTFGFSFDSNSNDL